MWERITDVGESGEEEPVLNSNGRLQFALYEHGERAFSPNLPQEEILLLKSIRKWKKMNRTAASTSE